MGRYDNINATVGEMELGFTPGTEAQVFAADFGNFGVPICFDVNWPGTWEHLRQQRADIELVSIARRARRIPARRVAEKLTAGLLAARKTPALTWRPMRPIPFWLAIFIAASYGCKTNSFSRNCAE